jgi:type II secretory pathway pseudopilin PulG
MVRRRALDVWLHTERTVSSQHFERRARRAGFTLVELAMAALCFAFVAYGVATFIEMGQAGSKTRRALVDQQPVLRRAVAQYATACPVSCPAVVGNTQTITLDSVQVGVTRVTNTVLGGVPRVQFVLTDTRTSAGAKPDSVTIDFHPLVSRVGRTALGDARP